MKKNLLIKYFGFFRNPSRQIELIYDSQRQSFNGAPFIRGAPVVIIIDGFLSTANSSMSQTTKDGRIKLGFALVLFVMHAMPVAHHC